MTRIAPFLCVGFLAAYIDRVNVGFAKLQMRSDLHMSETVYGLGASPFFLGYIICEIPGNMILVRGVRAWIARIMLTWGLSLGGMVYVHTPMSFYVLRFLLGVAEAGLMPGVLYDLTEWFPAERREGDGPVHDRHPLVEHDRGGPVRGDPRRSERPVRVGRLALAVRVGRLAADRLSTFAALPRSMATSPWSRSPTPGCWGPCRRSGPSPRPSCDGPAAAAGLALAGSIANVAGFFSTFLVGWVKDLTHSTNLVVVVFAGCLLVSAVAMLLIPKATANRVR